MLTPDEFTKELYETLDRIPRCETDEYFVRFISGKFNRADLQNYHRLLYHVCHNFVKLVSAVHTHARNLEEREVVAQNFVEEYAFGKLEFNHPRLALEMAKRTGLTQEYIEKQPLPPGVQEAFSDIQRLAMSSFVEGLAALIVTESDLTRRHPPMRRALVEYYGVPAEQLKYYDEHISEGSSIRDSSGYGGDEVHVAREIRLLASGCATGADQDAVRRAIQVTAQAHLKFAQSARVAAAAA